MIQPRQLDEQAAVAEMQKIITYGSLEEAHKYAVQAQLWSHALLLASSISAAAFKQTTMSMAESSLREGSPLRTVYQLLSGKRQDLFNPNNMSALGALLERWRENLVTLLNYKASNDKSVIGAMGDKIWSYQRRVEAAHCWYVF